MDRSTRNLSIITLLVLAIFLALNNVSRRYGLMDWGGVLFFLLLALAIWFYDRVSRRGIEDSEVSDTVIEPLVYDHANAPIGIPDSIELVAPNPGTVIHAVHPVAPVIAEYAPPVYVEPVTPPPTTKAEVNVEAPAPAAEQPPASASVTTTIEEKSAPPPSAPAAETHPDLAAKTPAAANLPSTPVTTSAQPVPTPVAGSSPEPAIAPPAVSAVPPKTATELGNPYAKELGSEDSVEAVLPVEPGPKTRRKGKGKGKAKPAVPDIEVSASAAAAATPSAPDPNLPKNAVVSQPDDLKIIEGIGPKMEKALQAAGITTFAMLAGASEAQLIQAITAAGMRFAPTVPTWAEQASYAANGDFVGLEAFQKTLIGGRKAK